MTVDAGEGTAAMGLPAGMALYRSTPVFTEASVPSGLLRQHRTAPGVWALIRVLDGRLLYRVLAPLAERVLEPGLSPGVAGPGLPHEIAPLGRVRFRVEFYRAAEISDDPPL